MSKNSDYSMLCVLDHRLVISVKALKINETFSAGGISTSIPTSKGETANHQTLLWNMKMWEFPPAAVELSFLAWHKPILAGLQKQSPNSSYHAVSEDGGIRSKRSEGDAGQPTEE